MAFRAGPAEHKPDRSHQVKRGYWIIVGVIIAVVLIVLFVPGVGNYIESTLLGWLARTAS